jgi:hypothetical protein
MTLEEALTRVDKLVEDKRDLIAALEHLLAKPRCGACRRAVRQVLDRIQEGK